MKKIVLTATPITRENFAPYGDIIAIQQGTELSAIGKISDTADMAVKVITANAYNADVSVPFFERHPLSSQAFIPMNGGAFFVLVSGATNSETFDPATLKCFITDGTQGIQYKASIWHAPFCCLTADKTFVVLERHPNNGDTKDININFTKFADTKVFVDITI